MAFLGLKICKECGKSFHYQSGAFTNHLRKEHNMSLRNYVIKYEFDNDINKLPRCQCGYCNEIVPFSRGKFLDGHIYRKHQNNEWQKEQYIKKYGIPKCQCGNEITNFYRGKPRKFCDECIKNNNHIKLNNGVFKTGIVSGRDGMIKKYGIINPGQIQKNRENASKRMIEYNSDIKKNHKIKKYKNTNLYYQSSYEYNFLELCENKNILDRISNGHSYNYLLEDKEHGIRTITDFSIDNTYEVEIKSSYIMKKQGGIEKIFAKKRAIESKGKKYLFLLDKDYSNLNRIL